MVQGFICLLCLQAPAPQDSLCGMAGRGPDPAALLSIYLQHDRLTDAANLVLEHLEAYQKVCQAVVLWHRLPVSNHYRKPN